MMSLFTNGAAARAEEEMILAECQYRTQLLTFEKLSMIAETSQDEGFSDFLWQEGTILRRLEKKMNRARAHYARFAGSPAFAALTA